MQRPVSRLRYSELPVYKDNNLTNNNGRIYILYIYFSQYLHRFFLASVLTI